MDKPSICFIGEGTVSDEIRLGLSGEILKERGYKVITSGQRNEKGEIQIPEQFDVAVFSRPHSVNVIEGFKKRGVKIIIDQDDDFWNIPKTHVAYNGIGPGNRKALELSEQCLALADVVTTPSPTLLKELMGYTKAELRIIPNGWSKRNPFWSIPRNNMTASTINIGWAGTITHRTDFLKCRSAVLDILAQFENTRIVIGQDVEIYKMFDRLPENRKLFLPPLPYSLYPTMLSYIDIWLAPLEDNLFNESKSDIKLVDAGARGIPWIASPLPAYVSWGVGGKLAKTSQDWFDAMEYYLNPEHRKTDSEFGRQRSSLREQEHIVDEWEKLLEDL